MKKNLTRVMMVCITIFMGLQIISCDKKNKDNEPDVLILGAKELSFGSAGGEQQTVTIQCNWTWIATTDANWIAISPQNGTENGSISITINTPNETTVERIGTVTVTSGQLSESITIKQAAKSGPSSLVLSASELLYGSSGGEQQTVNILTDWTWSVSTDSDWIDLSPKNGNGNGSISITVNTPNETSKERSGTVTVTSEDLSEKIIIKQKASLTDECTAQPINFVTLGDQFAFDIDFGKNVAYFQFDVMEAKDAKRISDSEIIAALNDKDRYVEEDDYYYAVIKLGDNALLPETEYIVFTLAHDDKGNRGELIKTTVTTRSLTNQPEAYISNLRWTGSEWHWDTAIDAYTYRYYQIIYTTTELSFSLYYKLNAAYWIERHLREDPTNWTPAIQSGSWRFQPSRTPYIGVFSWAQNREGEWSGVVCNDWANLNWYSSASHKKSKSETPKKDMGKVKKPAKNAYQIVRCN